MRIVVASAEFRCLHGPGKAPGGTVDVRPTQELVRVGEDLVLVEDDPLHRPIIACPHATLTTPPCLNTISVDEPPSYSSFVRIEGHRVCKDSTVGRTDWSMIGIVTFGVIDPGQTLVTVSE